MNNRDDHEIRITKLEICLGNVGESVRELVKVTEHVSSDNKQIKKAVITATDKLTHEIEMMNKERHEEQKFSQNVFIWVGTCLAMLIFSVLLIEANKYVLNWVETVTSVLTCITLLLAGLSMAKLVLPYDKQAAARLTVAWGMLFFCYCAYIFENFGGTYPEVAAIGFNISTIATVLASFDALKRVINYKIKRRMEHLKIDDSDSL